MVENVTPLVITFDEAPNIRRVLDRLSWARRIVVVDSFSTDGTLDVLASYPQVEVFQRRFDSFAGQCNFGLRQVASEWVLSLDADYVLTNELIEELASLRPDAATNSFSARFKYCIFGKPLRGALLPPRKVLYRRAVACYEDDGHAHRVLVPGETKQLAGYIHHDDRKPLSRWLSSQARYMVQESKKLRATPLQELSTSDRLRRHKTLAPFVVMFYCLFVQKGALDGWAGWYYALQRTLAEILLAIQLIEDENLSASNGKTGVAVGAGVVPSRSAANTHGQGQALPLQIHTPDEVSLVAPGQTPASAAASRSRRK